MALSALSPFGVEIIQQALKILPGRPGVYQMIDPNGNRLYVGKAKNLKKRVTNYTQLGRLSRRLIRMVSQTSQLKFEITQTEAEALLLESNLIKHHKPRYNILLRDDKSFPEMCIRMDHPFPQIIKHRGAHKKKCLYVGPFANVGAVNRTLIILQKTFLLRTCSDNEFGHRTRPCLQYQIKRCSAPCVGFISQEDYAQCVQQAKDFLLGRSTRIQKTLSLQMQKASQGQHFEKAASLRDRLQSLVQTQSHQDINLQGLTSADIFAVAQQAGRSSIQVIFVRGGRHCGSQTYFPRHTSEATTSDILTAFLPQFYENKLIPRFILLSHFPQEGALLQEAFSSKASHKVRLAVPKRGRRQGLIKQALLNAKEALTCKLLETRSQRKLLVELARFAGLSYLPQRIEVYDNSHIQGTHSVGGMIVAGPEGFIKKAYRKYNIKSTTVGDDFAMMREVLTRRFGRTLRENDPNEVWPDILLIDGGAGQMTAVTGVLKELGVLDRLAIIGVAKGPDRNAGREELHRLGKPPKRLEKNNPLLYYIQRLRDEAHRFAITSHRKRRSMAIIQSPLDEVPGIGAQRKKILLRHFGSAKAVTNAGVPDLEKVVGISQTTAQAIYDFFHT